MKMKKIKLGKTENYVLVDDEDYEVLNKFSWYGRNEHGYKYAARSIMFPREAGKRRVFTEKMHRKIMNAKTGQIVDHINGNTFDNRKNNLRICTREDNTKNRSKNYNNTSGYKGVSFHKNYKRWISYIGVNGKLIHLGWFDDKKEAALAYNEAAKKYFGEFARLNNF